MQDRILTLIVIALLTSSVSYSQEINYPNAALKSHETLGITKVEIDAQKTVIFLTLENKITGGYFCADRNINIIYPDGTRSKLVSSDGIPVCPETYKFKLIGEKLNFRLTFPALRKGTEWIDLKEDCNDNCFAFYGICLNNDLNKKIDEASILAEKGEPAKASLEFIKIAGSLDNSKSGIQGLVYMNIIELSKETGNISNASEWYSKLKSSGIPGRDLYIKHLNSEGIIY